MSEAQSVSVGHTLGGTVVLRVDMGDGEFVDVNFHPTVATQVARDLLRHAGKAGEARPGDRVN